MGALVLPRTFFCRRVSFNARHHYRLRDLDEAGNRKLFGASADSHSHYWNLTLWFEGPIDPRTGMIADLDLIDRVLKEQVIDRFDGHEINRVDDYFQNQVPTTENLARYFAEKLVPCFPKLTIAKVRVAECDDIFAEWLP